MLWKPEIFYLTPGFPVVDRRRNHLKNTCLELAIVDACKYAVGKKTYLLLPERRYASAGLCDSDVSVCPSVRLSVCHTPVLCLAERKQDCEMYTIW